jgi:hypothetical protein
MRMIAIADTMDGTDRATAARRGDVSHQALRNAIKRYNAEGGVRTEMSLHVLAYNVRRIMATIGVARLRQAPAT